VRGSRDEVRGRVEAPDVTCELLAFDIAGRFQQRDEIRLEGVGEVEELIG